MTLSANRPKIQIINFLFFFSLNVVFLILPSLAVVVFGYFLKLILFFSFYLSIVVCGFSNFVFLKSSFVLLFFSKRSLHFLSMVVFLVLFLLIVNL